MSKKELELVKCPKCGREVPLIKRPSVAGVFFLGWFYLIYYYLVKKPYCVYCGERLNKAKGMTKE